MYLVSFLERKEEKEFSFEIIWYDLIGVLDRENGSRWLNFRSRYCNVDLDIMGDIIFNYYWSK